MGNNAMRRLYRISHRDEVLRCRHTKDFKNLVRSTSNAINAANTEPKKEHGFVSRLVSKITNIFSRKGR